MKGRVRKEHQTEYCLVDKTLPSLKVTNDNSGVDVYSRTEMDVPPSFCCIPNPNFVLGQQEIQIPGMSGMVVKNNQPQFFIGVANPPVKIPLNVIIKGDCSLHYQLFPRSSLCMKKGFIIANSVGVIDPSYRGENDEICMLVYNLSWHAIKIRKAERIGQLMFLDRPIVHLKRVEEHWGDVDRGGFGSTG